MGGLIDRNGNFVARSREHDLMVGKPASLGFRSAALKAKEGWFEFSSLEGKTLANYHVTSELSGWTMALATEKAVFEAPIRRTVLIAGLAGGLATLIAVLIAVWAARKSRRRSSRSSKALTRCCAANKLRSRKPASRKLTAHSTPSLRQPARWSSTRKTATSARRTYG